MPNKIDGYEGSRPASPGAGRLSQRSRTSAGVPASAPQSTESVHITDTASQLAALEQALREFPAVDGSRVAALRTAIEQGTYTVSPETIADHLMQLEQAFDVLGQHGK